MAHGILEAVKRERRVAWMLLSNASDHFLWLSGQRPAFAPGDLQAWIRNAALDPDWLRVGTDIVGGVNPPLFDAAFSLSGEPPHV